MTGHRFCDRQFFVSKSKDFPTFGGEGPKDNTLLVQIDCCPGGLDFLVYEVEGGWAVFLQAPLYTPVGPLDSRWEWDSIGPFESREEAVKNVPKAALQMIESIRTALDDLELVVEDADHLADLSTGFAEAVDETPLSSEEAAKVESAAAQIKKLVAGVVI